MPAALQPLECIRRTAKTEVGTVEPALGCLHQLRSLQRFDAFQAEMVVVIAQTEAASVCSPFSPLGAGLAAMGDLATEFGPRQGQVVLAEGLAAQLLPALVQEGQAELSTFGAAGGMQDERRSSSSRRVMRTDVVGLSLIHI